jgi:universal stress protein E
MQLLRKCPCPIWIIKSQPAKPSRIMAAVDPDALDAVRNALNTRILEIAASLAANKEGELHIANAWTAPGESLLRSRVGFMPEDVSKYLRNVLNEQANQVDALLRRADVTPPKHRIHLVKGDVGRVLPELARKKRIHLLIVGSLSRTGIAGWFIGNTVEKVLHKVSCSVLVIKPSDFAPVVKSKRKAAHSGPRKTRMPTARVLHS